jgi:hypothetical protein
LRRDGYVVQCKTAHFHHPTTQDGVAWLLALVGIDPKVEVVCGSELSQEVVGHAFQPKMEVDENGK